MVLSFLKELWNNIFTPGTTPALVRATHLSFCGLLLTLCIMFYVTRSLHFIAMLVLSVILWGIVTWFAKEYNEFLEQQNAQTEKEKEKKEKDIVDEGAQPSTIRKRQLE